RKRAPGYPRGPLERWYPEYLPTPEVAIVSTSTAPQGPRAGLQQLCVWVVTGSATSFDAVVPLLLLRLARGKIAFHGLKFHFNSFCMSLSSLCGYVCLRFGTWLGASQQHAGRIFVSRPRSGNARWLFFHHPDDSDGAQQKPSAAPWVFSKTRFDVVVLHSWT
ncbi:unnamed protein product, partial [Prorocentrum cordatum]